MWKGIYLVVVLLVVVSSGCISQGNEDVLYIIEGFNQTEPIEIYYGEMWNYSANDTAWTFDIQADNIYYNMTGMIAGELYEFNFTEAATGSGGSYLTAFVDGLYIIQASLSFTSIGVGGLYGIGVVQNFDVTNHRDCYARRQAAGGITGNVGITCIIDISAGDTINMQVEQEGTPVKDLKIHTINVNLVRISE